MKTLSIIIPAYNMEKYLSRCLDSALILQQKIELIIINDGSIDKTLQIAKQYKKQYPNIKLINKENGGHGSAINAGIQVATGKYVRVLDSDDWFNTEKIDEYLKFIDEQEVDMVLTEFSINDTDKHKIVPFKFHQLKPFKWLKFADINKIPDDSDKINILSLHTITIKTELIKAHWGDGLLEKTFYEDQEYVAKCILAARNFVVLPINIYQYFIGRNEQSMNSDKMFKNRRQHERVINSIIELTNQCTDKGKKELLAYRLRKIIKTHYWIYFYSTNLTKKERREYKRFKRDVLNSNLGLLKDITPKYKLRLFIGRNKNKLKKKGLE